MDLELARRFYALELEAVASLRSPAVVEAFARVPREKFLGPGPWQIPSGMPWPGLGPMEYRTTPDADPVRLCHNVLVAIDAKRNINNGQPSLLASLIDALELGPGDSALHVGCGVGYYTAIIAEVVGPKGRVVGVEIDPGLAERARALLGSAAQVIHGNGTESVGELDAILINAGATHPLPSWLDALKPGGRLLLPLTAAMPGMPGGTGVVFKIQRTASGFSARALTPISIFPCEGAREPRLEQALAGLLRSRGAMGVRSLRRDPHERQDSCVVHDELLCLSTLPP